MIAVPPKNPPAPIVNTALRFKKLTSPFGLFAATLLKPGAGIPSVLITTLPTPGCAWGCLGAWRSGISHIPLLPPMAWRTRFVRTGREGEKNVKEPVCPAPVEATSSEESFSWLSVNIACFSPNMKTHAESHSAESNVRYPAMSGYTIAEVQHKLRIGWFASCSKPVTTT
jgi:hypothetical protein